MKTNETKTYREMAAQLKGKSAVEIQALYGEKIAAAEAAKSPATQRKYMHQFFACEDALKGALGAWA